MNAEQRISEHGARIAAGRIGVTVEEYRERERYNEYWCPRCKQWTPGWQFSRGYGRSGYCRPCLNAYRSQRWADARAYYLMHLATQTVAPIAHAYCPAVLGCRSGQLPAGWVREAP